MDYYPSKEGNLAICNKMMDLDEIMPCEISQTDKDRYHVISLTSGIWR